MFEIVGVRSHNQSVASPLTQVSPHVTPHRWDGDGGHGSPRSCDQMEHGAPPRRGVHRGRRLAGGRRRPRAGRVAASGRRPSVQILGTDYPTPDGTCIRDYIHVNDLADAHILALQALDTDKAQTAYNLGNGTGYSVRQVIETAAHVTGHSIATRVAPRRPGDPPRLVAAADKIRSALGWQPRYTDLPTIIATAWRWECQRRYG